MYWKKRLSLILILAIMMSFSIPAITVNADHSSMNLKVFINGEEASFEEAEPELQDNIVYVPLQELAEQAGWIMELEPGTLPTERVKLYNHTGTFLDIRATVGELYVNGELKADTNPYVQNDSVMVPLQAAGELLNSQVIWDEIDGSVHLLTPLFRVFQDRWAVVPLTEQEITIDGQLNETVWENAAVFGNFTKVFTYKPAAAESEVNITYDDENLYLGLKTAYSPEEDLNVQRGYQIMLTTPSNPQVYFHIPLVTEDKGIEVISTYGATIRGVEGEVSMLELDGLPRQTAKSVGLGGEPIWTTELAIPLERVGADSIAPGEEWNLNVLQYYFHNGHPVFETLYPVYKSYYWDQGTTVERPEPRITFRADIVHEGRMAGLFFDQLPSGRTPWNLEQIQFEYKNIDEKGFSFVMPDYDPDANTLELIWKSPAGIKTQLENVQLTKAGERVVVTFEHPLALERGAYELEIILLKQGGAASQWTAFAIDSEELIAAGIRSFEHRVNREEGIRTEVEWEEASGRVQNLLNLIPDQVGFIWLGDPVRPDMNPQNLYTWSADRPNELVSTADGKIYPNAEYPEDHTLAVTNRKGETVQYPYYEQDGKRYFFSAHLWYKQREYAINQTNTIADSDPLGAARLLYQFAKAYEGYVPVNDYLWQQYPIDPNPGVPNPYWGGMWQRWFYNDLMTLQPLVNAYSKVRNTNVFEQLSAEAGENVDTFIVEKMFKPSAEFVKTYAPFYGNMDPQIWNGYFILAQAIDEPDYIHDVLLLVREYLDKTYLSDGFFMEVANSYHDQSNAGFINLANRVSAWADPPGYLSPRSGIALDNIDLAEQYPIIQKARQIPRRIAYANGSTLPVNDTWANERYDRIEAGSLLLPAAGISRLSRNQGDRESQLYMTFSPKYGHNHYDPLNITLFANGQELLSDIGYTQTLYRYASLSALGHNTVVVDSQDMNVSRGRHGGNIEMFMPVDSSLQMMRAEFKDAYPHVELYSREPWYVGLPYGDGTAGYIVDLFRVSGGNRHEYTLHGDANHDAAIETSVSLDVYGPNLLIPGSEWTEATGQLETGSAEGNQYPGYIYMKDVEKADIYDGEYELDFVTYAEDSTEKQRLKVRGMVGGEHNELFVGKFPSLRMTRTGGRSLDTNEQARNYYMPKFVLRRDGDNLKSIFATVMEPYFQQQGTIIEATRVLNDDASESGNIAVEITYGHTTDLILSSNNPDQPFTVEDITLKGKAGFIRLENGEVQTMTLLGGTLLKKGNIEVVDQGVFAGSITGTMRVLDGDPYNAIVTDAIVPPGVAGRYMVVTLPDSSTRGFQVQAVVAREDDTVLILEEEDPGFRIYEDGRSVMTSYPEKQWMTGGYTYTIDNVATELSAGQLTVTPERSVLTVGESTPLAIFVTSQDGTVIDLGQADSIVYESSSPDIAAVSANIDGTAEITAKSPGTAIITVRVRLHGIELQQSAAVSVVETALPVRAWAPTFTDLEDREVTHLLDLDAIRVRAQVENVSVSAQSVALIVALCDFNGNVITSSVVGQTLAQGATEMLQTDVSLASREHGSFIKVMIWDSENGMQPYSTEISFPNGKGL